MLNMYNWAEICSELKELEKRVDLKISRISDENPNPIPHERIRKGKQIGTLSRALRQFIELEQEKDATVVLHMLQDLGVKLKAVR
jgi:hypothetical protein